MVSAKPHPALAAYQQALAAMDLVSVAMAPSPSATASAIAHPLLVAMQLASVALVLRL
jgi:hypothetical protein